MMNFHWIHIVKLVLYYFILCYITHATCPSQQLPIERPGCPGLFQSLANNKLKCEAANSACCFNGSASAQYPKCYYVPDLQNNLFNAALGKPTTSSSFVSRRESWKAVNGCKKDYTNRNPYNADEEFRECCFQSSTESNSQAWWSVDLTTNIPIISLTITADPKVAMKVTVSLSNISHNPNGATDRVKCATDSLTFAVFETKKQQCTANIKARYVIIELTAESTQRYLSLCDVQVETGGVFNAAFGKATSQSSTLLLENYDIDSSPYKSVDGSLLNQFWNSECSHTTSEEENPWWSVDLGEILIVYSVTLVNKIDDTRRLKWLTISVSNATNSPSTHLCGTHQPEIPIGKAQNILCIPPISARFINVQKKGDKELVLCEVLVEAECSNNYFGPSCQYACHCKDGQKCNRIDGSCPGGLCMPRLYGKNCSIACPYNRYGVNCTQDCHCRNKTACDFVNGFCPGGLCEKGFHGEKCDKVCTTGTFGYNCNSKCNCYQQKPCDSVDGICPNGVCDYGYRGDNCSKECKDFTYGISCSQSCINCRNNTVCDKITGHCPQGLCNKGYNGSNCDSACDGTFGYNCVNPCHCLNGKKCNHVNGYCPDGLCDSGYKGFNCSEDCPTGFYGYNCSSTCPKNCDTTTCDKKSGSCICKAGYQGDNCDKQCSPGTYGSSCRYSCSQFCLERGVCEPINGHCAPKQCKSGYIGDKCDQSCLAGKYGLDCLSNCLPHCSGPCDPADGACTVGCEDGWTGKQCDTAQSNSLVVPIVAPTAGIIILVIVCLIAAYFFMKLRQSSKQPDTDKMETRLEDKNVNMNKSTCDERENPDFQQTTYYKDVDTEMGGIKYHDLDKKEIGNDENQHYEVLKI